MTTSELLERVNRELPEEEPEGSSADEAKTNDVTVVVDSDPVETDEIRDDDAPHRQRVFDPLGLVEWLTDGTMYDPVRARVREFVEERRPRLYFGKRGQ